MQQTAHISITFTLHSLTSHQHVNLYELTAVCSNDKAYARAIAGPVIVNYLNDLIVLQTTQCR